jgi:hypothetical protein
MFPLNQNHHEHKQAEARIGAQLSVASAPLAVPGHPTPYTHGDPLYASFAAVRDGRGASVLKQL